MTYYKLPIIIHLRKNFYTKKMLLTKKKRQENSKILKDKKYLKNDTNQASASEKKRKHIKVHTEFNDYFGTLATILNLVKQGGVRKRELKKMLEKQISDLDYLQSNYKIVKKSNVRSDKS